MTNIKVAAWDIVGGLFWEQGRKSAKPSIKELEEFTNGIKRGDRVAVIGASTKELVERLIRMETKVTVYDFSRVMCDALREALTPNLPNIEVLDITVPLEDALLGSFDFVLNDRLINRFTSEEAEEALTNMVLLAKDGEVRTSIKLGSYPMDERMISLGKERGNLDDFYDSKTKTINFALAGDVLKDALLPHGDIDTEILLQWYQKRGVETRYSDADFQALVNGLSIGNGAQVTITNQTDFPDAKQTIMYTLKIE
ncbi:class I SAM-dependent methyltransferase [Photorhabdus luminescens]|uniref:class I SAM-dependent methyltransferase n=1 Tax=Photorhabdus luminescens TaxID=29488 RepID=UPI0022402324|nr:class I SAM-dependent methyltransferase [Photorhabdus luminescens]MCW7762564.1 class I SAM-dependent methyltransferase [Photorhabdus luminescens subsp. venezuelensis]